MAVVRIPDQDQTLTSFEEARDFLATAGLDVDKVAPLIDGKFMSAFVRATKPRG